MTEPLNAEEIEALRGALDRGGAPGGWDAHKWFRRLLALAGEDVSETPSIDVGRLGLAMDAVLPDLRGEQAACEHGANDQRYLPIEAAPSDYASAVVDKYVALLERAVHQAGDNHDYRIECTVCGERGTIRLSVDPGRFGERAALAAGTHEPAVDDFGTQFLLPTQASDSPEKP